MTTTRRSRDDVVDAAGKLFAERGYHGTSMRDLGKALGLQGSSLYSHISSKEDLLVDVVRRGAELFQSSADAAMASTTDPADRLRALVGGHIAVIVDHLDDARTFLNEARALDPEHRREVIDARDRYEGCFRSTIQDGIEAGAFDERTDPRTSSIFLLSILNAIDRWYRIDGDLDPEQLTDEIVRFATRGMRHLPVDSQS